MAQIMINPTMPPMTAPAITPAEGLKYIKKEMYMYIVITSKKHEE